MGVETIHDTARLDEGIQMIKDWLAKLPHMPMPDDDWIRRFLIGCKYSVERTKQVMDLYYAVRKGVPDFFSNRDPTSPAMKNFRKCTYFFTLPKRSPEGYEIFVSRIRNPDPAAMNVVDYAKHSLMVADVLLQEIDDYNGCVVVYDMLHFGMSHLMKVTLPFAKKYAICAQDSIPVRVKQIHFINAPGFAEMLISIFKPLLKEKISKRIIIHSGGLESLYKYLPRDVLPSEYGGNEESLEKLSDLWDKKLESYKDYFLTEERKIGALPDRPEKTSRESELFGMEGSFRRLDID